MATNGRLVTIAVHTCERALQLKKLLESNHIPAELQNINLEHPTVSSGIRVRIPEERLPDALLIIENPDSAFRHPELIDRGLVPQVLVPVDFSTYSYEAAKIAIRLANLHSAYVVFLHTYTSRNSIHKRQLRNVLEYEYKFKDSNDKAEEQATQLMDLFISRIQKDLFTGELPRFKIKTIIKDGLPEEIVLQQAREFKPLLIVMGTRGKDRKERDLIGSVTAEVLDSSRIPVLTVPDGMQTSNVIKAENVLFFINDEQSDILAMHKLVGLLDNHVSEVTLVKLNKHDTENEGLNNNLLKYLSENFPSINFTSKNVPLNECETLCREIELKKSVELIAIPSKHRSAFARLFNPGLAHRLLFSADIPLITIPV